jgi:hypothetical protein
VVVEGKVPKYVQRRLLKVLLQQDEAALSEFIEVFRVGDMDLSRLVEL